MSGASSQLPTTSTGRRVLVTGSAGFIGFHVCAALAARGDAVRGFDNFNDYYDITLKETRAGLLQSQHGVETVRGDLAVRAEFVACAEAFAPTHVVNLAAQAGVRYSAENPQAYVESNVTGFLNVLEYCRAHASEVVLTYASSSSVYGLNTEMPFSVADRTDRPASLYAATKKANELMAHAYWNMFGVRSAGLRFFTVYGPYGRPDMAAFIFARKIFANEPIDVFNNGDMKRDFTYIDDIVRGVLAAIDRAPDCAVYNLGNCRSEQIGFLITLLEREIGRKAQINHLPMQSGDVKETFADVELSERELGYRPTTPLCDGIKKFVAWYREFYQPEAVTKTIT
jgi:UDP-glucuronate 4-epimerase